MKSLYLSIVVITTSLVLLSTFASVLPPSLETSGSAFFMKSNSTAHIYANFTFKILNNESWTLRPQILASLSDPSSVSDGLTIDAIPNSFYANKNNVNVTYTITTKANTEGVYALFLYNCGLSPLVIGLNESGINPEIFNKFFTARYGCPAGSNSAPIMNIIGYSDMISKIILVNQNGTHDTNLVNQLGQVPKSPLKQLEAGIKPLDVKCREGFLLVTKHDNGSPACVTTSTAVVLAERGWTTNVQIYKVK